MFKLRELERPDIAQINRWRNDPQLIASLGAPFRFINQDVDDAWYEGYLSSRDKNLRCAIVEEGREGQILGLISLTSIDAINRSAELSIMIGDKENRGKGMGIFAVRKMLDHGFMNMNLNRIELSLLETNTAALGLYEKAGFVREGLTRQSNYKNGKYISSIIMGVLKDEYLAKEQ